MAKNNASSYERELKEIFMAENFMVVRAAGSHGADLVILHSNTCFPIEVKTSADETIRFSSASNYANKQATEFLEDCKRAELVPIYAFRLMNTNRGGLAQEKWRIFTIPNQYYRVPERYCQIRDAIPKLEQTGGGGFMMRWNKGMYLTEFLRLIG